ncbi:Histidinol-phosphate aminotransferase [Smittium culicis]|uniref:histidinol-phosphate transaminase n=1 Tax=Smittium culicis TaxID=133412 RepID=A0A1R1Y838_9FUNG|nr:Histidinol-phosphate aminotransferase [Smittium culicis]OMJ10394.1 Histidinol-phosphate aminotransferase [Smittium culicis]OMJ23127.1 Histidinol-phosphate aminotransferase [Smittium culicis]
MTFNLKEIVRPNILQLLPYRCARDDYSTGVLLDANENNYGPTTLMGDGLNVREEDNPLSMHRYPDPLGVRVKKRFMELRQNIESIENIFMGVGSDEIIDISVRIFCKPGVDEMLITPPTYGMYKVVSQINDVKVVSVPLNLEDGNFQLETDKVK